MTTAKKKTERDETKVRSTCSLKGDTGKQLTRSIKNSPALKGQTDKALKERIKELNCFFGISAIMELPDIPLDEIVKKIVVLLPPAWQFPEIAEACIVLEGKTYQTSHFQKTSSVLVRDIMVNGNPVGHVMVCYREEHPKNYTDPFLIEERHLLDAITERLGHIIERKWAEKALKESEEKFRGIFNTVNDGIHIHEIEPDGKPGKFIEVNEVACRMLQYTLEELLKYGPLDFVTDYHNRPLNEIIGELSSTGHAIFETGHRRKDGTIVQVEINSHVVQLQGKQVVVGVVRNVTDRKLAEDALIRVNQKLSILSQLTRQDLSTHIFVLHSYLEMVKKLATGQDGIIKNIESGERAIRSIREITEFTRDYQNMGEKPPKWQNIKLAILFGLSHISIGEIRHSLETDNLEIFADSLLEKAFQGLLENSVAHGGHVSLIRVSHTVTPDGVTILFEDDGIGISEEKKEQIFLRGDGTRASVRGLFFVREILDITGITIRETGEPGKGARFEITVPKGAWRMTGNGA